MKNYYDPLYGKIELDSMVFDIINKCPELKRLRYIGMMNFKSLSMLSLTSISRLEHTIGLTYLSQIFADKNSSVIDNRNDLLVAALFHDVNCGSFGHSIEWALSRYTPYNHEKETDWLLDRESTTSLNRKPIFIEQYGINRYKLDKEYKFDFNKVNNLIKGTSSFIINNMGIDLDNIDNVFRMGLHLGLIPANCDAPIKLANNLRIKPGLDNFIIEEHNLNLVILWHKLRTTIYRDFIYSDEYMGYEYLLFKLISEYAKNVEPEGLINLFHHTDEKLLWYFYEKKDLPHTINNIARMLLLHDLPQTYSIIRTKDFNKKENLSNPELLENLSTDLVALMQKSKITSHLSPTEIFYHVTTDDRKTERKIDIYIEKDNQHTRKTIGEDAKYIVIGILGKKPLSQKAITFLTEKTIEILHNRNLGIFEKYDFAIDHFMAGTSLF